MYIYIYIFMYTCMCMCNYIYIRVYIYIYIKNHCAALLFHFAAELSNENIVGIVKKEEFLCNPLRSPSFRPNPRKNGQDLGFDRSSGARPPSHQNLTENLRRNPPVAEIKIVKHFTFSFDLLLSSKQSYRSSLTSVVPEFGKVEGGETKREWKLEPTLRNK